MKCIQCNTDNNLRDRTANQGRCKQCNHPFVFEPTAMGKLKMTDGFFSGVIANLSVNNTLFFSSKQLLYFLDKKLKRKGPSNFVGYLATYLIITGIMSLFLGSIVSGALGGLQGIALVFFITSFVIIWFFSGLIKADNQSKATRKDVAIALIIIGGLILLIGIGGMSVLVKSFIVYAVSVLLGIGTIYLGITSLQRLKSIADELSINPSVLNEWIRRWQEINGDVSYILPELPRAREEIAIAPEVANYSFDRVVVSDSSATARFLIANNFHFENNCAVLSITGYPENIFSAVLEMLKRNPDLAVYALHDASPRGVSLVYSLKSSDQWFANSTATIYDLGIVPKQVLNNKKVVVLKSSEYASEAERLPLEVKQSLSPEELKWLEQGNYVELESFTPQKLLQLISRGINLSRSGDGDMLVPLDSYSQDSTLIYAVDSFG